MGTTTIIFSFVGFDMVSLGVGGVLQVTDWTALIMILPQATAARPGADRLISAMSFSQRCYDH